MTTIASFIPHFHRENNPAMSAECRMQSAECRVQSSKRKVQSVFHSAFCSLNSALTPFPPPLCTRFAFFFAGIFYPFIKDVISVTAFRTLLSAYLCTTTRLSILFIIFGRNFRTICLILPNLSAIMHKDANFGEFLYLAEVFENLFNVFEYVN